MASVQAIGYKQIELQSSKVIFVKLFIFVNGNVVCAPKRW